ncbi:hypothetical protein ZWY2020_014169 [Hordeum vulgare]|nr:hypothetical protein ZWY2020_019657 [Hordeum vulgare]KAI4963392.1 hypothetical protein ZWY2020_014169 [Hordeum vulgare]
MNEIIDICFDPFTIEALGVRFGLNLARTVGCSRIMVSSGSLEIVEALKNGNSSSVASTIIDDCFFMSSEFNHVVYDHCFTESNKVAHELSRLVKFSSPSCWLDTTSPEVLSLLVNDTTVLDSE